MPDEQELLDAAPLAVQEPQRVAVFHTTDPIEVLTTATRIADALKQVVLQKGLVKNIRGKEYPLVEAWTTLGAMLGIFPAVEWTRKIENGWEARVVIKCNGLEIGAAESQCTRDETMWKHREDFAIRSMAQTRAVSKALRMPLGFIMTLSGFQATPAEEMPTEDEPRKKPHPKSKAPEGFSSEDAEKLRHYIVQINIPGAWVQECFTAVLGAGKTAVEDIQSTEQAREIWRLLTAKTKELTHEIPL